MSVAPAALTPLLQLRGIETFYGKIQALRGVDLDVNKGEIVTLIGANGAGKSTTMMTIFGAPRARNGRITFDGHDITNLPTHMIARLSIAQSPEGRRIFPRMTVFENLQMGASINNFANFDEDLQRMFALFPRLKERAPQRGGTLSGGEQQMLAIGRALMSRPRLLLLDEPSLGLAPLVVKQIFEVIAELNKSEGLTVFENLQMGASIDNFAHFDEDLERAFTMFPRLKERAQQRGGTLSGGEQQMLAIARALMSRPRLLLLDEPSLGLAPLVVKMIFNAIAELNRTQGLSVFLVEQNARLALELVDRVFLLETGRVVTSGPPHQIAADESVRRAYLGQ